MTIFYRGPLAVVTRDTFEAHRPTQQQYAIRDLTEVHLVEEPLTRVVTSIPLKLCSVAVTAPAAVAAAVAWSTFRQPAMSVLALAMTVISGAVAVVCWLIRPTEYELRARYRGEPVILLATTDRVAIRQINRALRRVFEQLQDAYR
jgi:uncharacterized protein DUF6232